MFFLSSRRRHTRSDRDWSSDVCSSDLTCSSSVFTRVVKASSAVDGVDGGAFSGVLGGFSPSEADGGAGVDFRPSDFSPPGSDEPWTEPAAKKLAAISEAIK